jgi:hypothetical protein
MDTLNDTAGLREVLDGLSYPAQKWQITTCAGLYGADMRTRRALYRLPTRVYESAADVSSALSIALAEDG